MTLRLLLVEDDSDIAAVATMALGMSGDFEVTGCSSGAQALEVLQRLRLDIVLLDVMMPEMDGPSTLAALRRLPGHVATPVIFLTARAQKDEVARYLDLGAIGVIPKPFDPVQLGRQVEELMRDARREGR